MSVEILLLPIAIAVIGGAMANQQPSSKQSTKPSETTFSITTRMTNPHILQTALRNWGCKSVTTAENVHTAIEGARIVFEQAEGVPFKAVFVGNIPTDLAQKFIADVYGEYTRLVQQDVYIKLKQRATAKGLVLESEEVQADDSIVLTLRVQE
jgi:hypothetical protein